MSSSSLNIVTWNITGLLSNVSYLSDLLNEGRIDIIGICEHWLYPHNMHFLNDYNFHAVCDKDLNINRAAVGTGGVSLMWNKKLDDLVTPLSIDDDHIVGIQLQLCSNQYIYIYLKCILPCVNHKINVFNEYIDKLYDLYYSYCDKGIPLFMGDFNAKVNTQPMTSRDKRLVKFLSDCNLCAVNLLNDCCGPQDIHRPVLCCMNVQFDNECASDKSSALSTGINWKKVNDANIKLYHIMLLNDDGLTNSKHCSLD
ncbi:hypothetical protein MAR_021067 [Mya arenaria]|uniref:Endonuclease/exonuclease/phosphatase domain-containing protein n=1 Tax=Mya arenaria TaxID=6604 RepID=A0ABY7E6T9_MYAAR|nr:hypothetical protein MAR_021067 [Mya arenaria]